MITEVQVVTVTLTSLGLGPYNMTVNDYHIQGVLSQGYQLLDATVVPADPEAGYPAFLLYVVGR